MFNKLPNDIIHNIINYIYSFSDFKKFRLVNKFILENCMNVWCNYKNDILDIEPRCTMICTRLCISCKSYSDQVNNIQMGVSYYSYPQPIYIICNNWRCVNNCITHMFCNAWEKNLVFLNLNNKLPNKCIIPRSNNEKTLANIGDDYLILKDNIYCNASWTETRDYYTKNINVKKLMDIDSGNILKIDLMDLKISSWYKDHIDDEYKINVKNIKELLYSIR
jgi:hypothetical protein